MQRFTEVPIAPRSLEGLRRQCDGAADRARTALVAGRRILDGHAVWNVNSTARGGGVAELLASLLSFARGADIDVRWGVISGDETFFRITKRLHHALRRSGAAVDDGRERATGS